MCSTICYPPGCREISDDLHTDELIRRLKTLAHTYQSMIQEDGAYNEYIPLAKHLSEECFREYPSKDVQLLVACCIADVLRIYAPDAPYKDPIQIKNIFLFLTDQLSGLKDPKDAAFKRYFYLLENMAYVKSFNMCLELEDCAHVMCALFSLMFKIVNAEHSIKVKNLMLDILCPLIHESDIVPNELLDILLMNIIEPIKSSKREAYFLAKDIITKCSTTLEPYIQAFFNHVLILGKEEKRMRIYTKVYDLIYELNHICPSVLLAVLPQLEFKLKSTEESERFHAVSLLALMFSEPGSMLAINHSQLWMAFLGRFNDISVKVRIKCVQYSMHFLINHPELRNDITETLKYRQHDSDESVRYEVVMAIVSTMRKEFSIVSESETLLNFVKERTLDKKFKIRKEAMCGLALIYRKYLCNLDVPSATRRAVVWIKDKILHGYYMSSMDDRLLVERIVNTCLVPFTLSSEERMLKLYYLYSTLDDHATKAFVEMQKQQQIVRKATQELLEVVRACVTSGSTSAANDREKTLRVHLLSKHFPESVKAVEFINKFIQHMIEDPSMLAHMESIFSCSVTCPHAMQCVNAILKRLGQPVMTNLYYNTIKHLLERISSLMIDHESLLVLIGLFEQALNGSSALIVVDQMGVEADVAVERGLRLLFVLACVQASRFIHENVIGTLVRLLVQHAAVSTCGEECGLRDERDCTQREYVVSNLLAVLYFVGKSGCCICERFTGVADDLVSVCTHLCVQKSPKQAKWAVRCLFVNSLSQTRTQLFNSIISTIKEYLYVDHRQFRTAIVALGHIAFFMPASFTGQMKVLISRNIVKELLTKDLTRSVELGDAWCDEHALDEIIRCKLTAMKTMARWLIGLKDDTLLAQKTFRMLIAFIVNRGDLLAEGNITKSEGAWLRLVAGSSMLKICEQKGVGDQFTAKQFYQLSQLMNDECLQVRERFANKLHKGLSRGIPHKCLPLDFMGFYALAGIESEKHLFNEIKSYVINDVNKRREFIRGLILSVGYEKASEQFPHIMPDYMLAFAAPVLAHDNAFVDLHDIDYLTRVRSCLWFILEPLMKSENYCFSFYKSLVESMKNHLDAELPNNEIANNKLWAVCDLAMGLLLTKTSNFEMRESSSEPRIPSMYFLKRQDDNFINTQIYLPAELQSTKKNPIFMNNNQVYDKQTSVLAKNSITETYQKECRRYRESNVKSDLFDCGDTSDADNVPVTNSDQSCDRIEVTDPATNPNINASTLAQATNNSTRLKTRQQTQIKLPKLVAAPGVLCDRQTQHNKGRSVPAEAVTTKVSATVSSMPTSDVTLAQPSTSGTVRVDSSNVVTTHTKTTTSHMLTRSHKSAIISPPITSTTVSSTSSLLTGSVLPISVTSSLPPPKRFARA